VAQLVAPWEGAHLWFAIAYVVLAIAILVVDDTRRKALLRLLSEARLALRGHPAAAEPTSLAEPAPAKAESVMRQPAASHR
jgi:hypothetical protein